MSTSIMSTSIKNILIVGGAVALSIGFVACAEKKVETPAVEATQTITEQADQAMENLANEGAELVEDANKMAEDAGNTIENVASEGAEMLEDAAKTVEDAVQPVKKP